MGFTLTVCFDTRRISRLLFCSKFFLILALALSACSPSPATSQRTPIIVQLSWLHQAQFAGFYAADQQGYFADVGLDV